MDQVEHGWALLQHPGSDCQRGLVMLRTTIANPDDDASGRSGIPQLSCGCRSGIRQLSCGCRIARTDIPLRRRVIGHPTTIPSPPDDLEATILRPPVAALCQAKDSGKPTRTVSWAARTGKISFESSSERVLPMLKADQTRLSALCNRFVA